MMDVKSKKNMVKEHMALAKERLHEFKKIKGLIGIVLNGGVARGYSDVYSEIDILIYLDEPYYRYYQTHKTPFELGISMHQGQLYDVSIISYKQEEEQNYDSLMSWDRTHAKILYEVDGKLRDLYKKKITKPPKEQISSLLFSAYWYSKIAGDVWMYREDSVQGHFIIVKAIEPLMKVLYLLNNQHIPHEKWLLHNTYDLPLLPRDYHTLLRRAMLSKGMTMNSLKEHQEAMLNLYHRISFLACKEEEMALGLEKTYDYHASVLSYLRDKKKVYKQDFIDKFNFSILNSAPFYQAVKIEGAFILFDEESFLDLEPSDMYSWHFALVDACRTSSSIRMLKESDLEDYLLLRKELWPKHSLSDLRREAENFLNDLDHTPVFLATNKEGDLVGFIEASIHKQAPGCETKKIGFIEGWYVKPEHQQLGLGRLLYERAEEWARTHGCLEMASDTTRDYPISPIAHLALGFKESKKPLNYYKAL